MPELVMMKNINVAFEDAEYKKLARIKGNRTWKEVLQQAQMGFADGGIIHHARGDMKVVKGQVVTLYNINDEATEILVKPNQIVVYTIYTLEKVE